MLSNEPKMIIVCCS